MGLIKFASKFFGAAGSAGKAMSGGTLSRMAVGGAIGGAVGAVGAFNSNDPNQQIGGVMKGMFAGALGGAATRLVTPAIRYGKNGAATTGMPMGLKAMGYAGAKGMGAGLKAGAKVGKFAINNPGVAVGITGAGVLGTYAMNGIATQRSSLNYDLDDYNAPNNPLGENAALQQLTMNGGVSPMGNMNTGTSIRAARMQQSTFGLVQGLNRGRH